MKNQSQATIDITVNYCKEKDIQATPFETDYNEVLSSDDKKAIVSMVFEGMLNKDIQVSEKSLAKFEPDHKAWRRYTVGLLNDRLRKAKALNGNVVYQAKEPGKLTGSRDPELKALQQVLTLDNTPEVKAEIQAEIDRRKSEIQADKATKSAKPINYDALPTDLRAKLGI
jgi:hypothetical protein